MKKHLIASIALLTFLPLRLLSMENLDILPQESRFSLIAQLFETMSISPENISTTPDLELFNQLSKKIEKTDNPNELRGCILTITKALLTPNSINISTLKNTRRAAYVALKKKLGKDLALEFCFGIADNISGEEDNDNKISSHSTTNFIKYPAIEKDTSKLADDITILACQLLNNRRASKKLTNNYELNETAIKNTTEKLVQLEKESNKLTTQMSEKKEEAIALKCVHQIVYQKIQTQIGKIQHRKNLTSEEINKAKKNLTQLQDELSTLTDSAEIVKKNAAIGELRQRLTQHKNTLAYLETELNTITRKASVFNETIDSFYK